MNAKKRDTRITIAKALGIIMVVYAHIDNYGLAGTCFYEFHMPLFFICAGYFFSLRYLNNEGEFVRRRFKGLYIPFVKWSVFFLIIHNLMFRLGILNEQYGNWSGGVTHPYTWHQAQQRLWNIVFSMGGYDEFLAGAFWFFRGLFVASILFLIFYKIAVWAATHLSRHDFSGMQRHGRLLQRTRAAQVIAASVCLVMFLLSFWKTAEGLKIVTLVQGGYRDLMGCFFFGIGFMLKPILNRIRFNLLTDMLLAAIVVLFALYSPASMALQSGWRQCLSLPVPALCGFLLTYDISCRLDRMDQHNLARRFLIYCGDNTLIVFVLHICAYKLVSAIKIMYYGLPWGEIGCHMTIHEHADDWFWIPYTIVGVTVPLLLQYGYDRLKCALSSSSNKNATT